MFESFFNAIRNLFKVPDLRKRVFFTLGMLLIYRTGIHIPVPGVDRVVDPAVPIVVPIVIPIAVLERVGAVFLPVGAVLLTGVLPIGPLGLAGGHPFRPSRPP